MGTAGLVSSFKSSSALFCSMVSGGMDENDQKIAPSSYHVTAQEELGKFHLLFAPDCIFVFVILPDMFSNADFISPVGL